MEGYVLGIAVGLGVVILVIIIGIVLLLIRIHKIKRQVPIRSTILSTPTHPMLTQSPTAMRRARFAVSSINDQISSLERMRALCEQADGDPTVVHSRPRSLEPQFDTDDLQYTPAPALYARAASPLFTESMHSSPGQQHQTATQAALNHQFRRAHSPHMSMEPGYVDVLPYQPMHHYPHGTQGFYPEPFEYDSSSFEHQAAQARRQTQPQTPMADGYYAATSDVYYPPTRQAAGMPSTRF
eukprot:m.157562 g.157562  ORF g.157562 m.157562 type:complete len:240 (+) comp52961_c0_seq5:143-862(+)